MTCEQRRGALGVGRASRPTLVCVRASVGCGGMEPRVSGNTCALCGTTPLL